MILGSCTYKTCDQQLTQKSYADLWLFVKSRDVPLYHLLHPVIGILFNCSPENEAKAWTDAPPLHKHSFFSLLKVKARPTCLQSNATICRLKSDYHWFTSNYSQLISLFHKGQGKWNVLLWQEVCMEVVIREFVQKGSWLQDKSG